MKRFLLVLAVTIMISFLPCLAFAEAENVTGDWSAAWIIVDGKTSPAADYQISLLLSLRDDGTVFLSSQDDDLGDTEEDGTWSIDGQILRISQGENYMVLMLRGDTLWLIYDGCTMVFERTSVE